MSSMDFVIICIISLCCVFIFLGLLSIVMWAITLLFPYKEITLLKKEAKIDESDKTLFAALHSTYCQIFPNHKITKIEEQK